MSFSSKRLSLSQRLLLWFTILLVSLLLSSQVILTRWLEHRLEHDDWLLIAEHVQSYIPILDNYASDPVALKVRLDEAEQITQQQPVLVRILGADKTLLAQTRLKPPPIISLIESLPQQLVTGKLKFQPTYFESWVGVNLAYQSKNSPSTWFTLEFALNREYEVKVLRAFRITSAGVSLVLLLLGIFVAFRMIREGFRPLDEMAESIRQIHGHQLTHLLPVDSAPTELRSLAIEFNHMLGRLDETFGRLSRFSSDIAHELRTPIQSLRLKIESTLQQSRLPMDYQETLEHVLERTEHLATLVDSLLFLAKAENPHFALRPEAFSISEMIEDLIDLYAPLGVETGVTILPIKATMYNDFSDRVIMDRTLIRQALGNLVQNSIHYGPPNSNIQIELLVNRESTIQIAVQDEGLGVPAEYQDRVFERFFRADPSRTTPAGNLGLGLSISQAIARLHKGDLWLSNSAKGARFCLELHNI